MFDTEELDELMDNLNNRSHFVFDQRNLEAVKYFCIELKNITCCRLTLSNLTAEHLKHITEALKGNTIVQDLLIKECDMGNEGSRYVAEVLKDTVINLLYISDSMVGDIAVKHLAEGLKKSKVTKIMLSYGTIGDDGLKLLADVWKDGKIIQLDLSNNKITLKSSKTLREMFELAGNRNIQLNLCHPLDETNYIMDIWIGKSQYPYITLKKFSSSVEISEFISKTFDHVNLPFIDFDCIRDDEISLLKDIINRISVKELLIDFMETNTNILKTILDIFQNSNINKFELSLSPQVEGRLFGVKLTQFQIECVKKNLPILGNILKSTGIRSLSIWINRPLVNYCIKILANAIKDTQVRHLEISTTLDAETATYFANIIEHTQLVSIKFIKNFLTNEPTEKYLEALAKNKKAANELCSSFDDLVVLNVQNNKLEFRCPKKLGTLNQYVTFVALLRKNPNLRTHVKDERLDVEDKIDEFVEFVEDRFNDIINNNILSLMHQHDDFNFIEFVKKCDSANLGHIVQNLLLHRQLYFVDDREEILHPLIYRMLHKYQLPLYDKRLEPNKKLDIIKYYMERPEIEGVQELVELLEHVCT